MEFNIRKTASFIDFTISEGSTTIHMGLLNESEQAKLANELLNGLRNLKPDVEIMEFIWKECLGFEQEAFLESIGAKII